MLQSFRRVAEVVLSASLLALAIPTGCATGDADSCERNSDCDAGYCLESKCRRDCVDAALDCPKGYACSAIGKCEFGGAGASGASTTGGAAGALAGTGGVTTGGVSGKGGAGASGSAQAGAAQGGAGSSQGGAGSSQAGAGSSQAGAGSSQAGASGDPFGGGGAAGAATGAAIELDRCDSDTDCASGLVCRADAKGAIARCTRTCSSNADCFGGRRCELIDGVKACVMGDVGRPCAAPSDCNFGCLLVPKTCTTPCATGADCPNGFACQAVGAPATRVCVKLSEACDADASACVVPAACDTKAPLIVNSCTSACDTAGDCPVRAAGLPAWTCDGTCRRPPDVLGPLAGGTYPTQWACGPGGVPVNLCGDGQHLDFEAFDIPAPPSVDCNKPTTTSGKDSDACVDSCRYKGGCGVGFACTAVGSVASSRIGLCLPTGGDPTGSPCKSGLTCEFGYCTAAGACSRDCTADGLCPTGTACVAGGGPPVEGMPFRRCQ